MNKPPIRHTASVHPATVTAISQGTLTPRRRQTYTRGPLRGQQYVIKVDPRVWSTALELAGGDATRIQIRSATEVVVTNKSKR